MQFVTVRMGSSITPAVTPPVLSLCPSNYQTLQLPWATCQTVLLCWCFYYIVCIYWYIFIGVYIYITRYPTLWVPRWAVHYVDTRGEKNEGRKGREAPIGPAMLPLPRILSANGSAGIWGGGWRWTETDGSWQTHTDSQWIQGSLAERSEQGWIKDRLTFKVSHCLVPPHCQSGEKSVYGSSLVFSVKLARAQC